MHDGKHHDSSGQVVKIGRNNKCHHRKRPNHTLAITGAKQLADKIETTIIVENFNNRHRRQQEQDYLCSSSHIWQEDKTGNKALDCCAGFWDGRSLTVQITRKIISMLTGYEIHTKTNIQNPSHRTSKNGHGSTVHLGNILRCYKETSQQ